MKQYNKLSKKYSDYIKKDPIKNYIQYPNSLKFLGKIKGKKVLDIGCGDGYLTRQIAKLGAKITAYDYSKKQIALALAKEKKDKLGIKYFVDDQFSFKTKEKFDLVISAMVLHYAENLEELSGFLESAHDSLKDKGRYVIITMNPSFYSYGKNVFNRKLERLKNKKARITFLNEKGEYGFSAKYSVFSKRDYEKCSKRVGFKIIKWQVLKITKEGIRKMGKEFWKDYYSDPIYIGIVLKKNN
jgi:2-polyprenyl-3-methyl-5-hydroxy-6-metoxy-1,4-benzoquinol methylase